MTLIKRYPNRKLYNTEKKEYIKLDGIASLIHAGEEIQVIDYATGDDLTALILTQVLFDQVKQQTGFLPRTVLTGLIQAGSDRISAIQRAVTQSLGLHQQADEEIRSRIQALIDTGELEPEQGYRLMDKLLGDSGQPQERSAGELSPGDQLIGRLLKERGIATHIELQALLDKIDALTAKLDEISRMGK